MIEQTEFPFQEIKTNSNKQNYYLAIFLIALFMCCLAAIANKKLKDKNKVNKI